MVLNTPGFKLVNLLSSKLMNEPSPKFPMIFNYFIIFNLIFFFLLDKKFQTFECIGVNFCHRVAPQTQFIQFKGKIKSPRLNGMDLVVIQIDVIKLCEMADLLRNLCQSIIGE